MGHVAKSELSGARWRQARRLPRSDSTRLHQRHCSGLPCASSYLGTPPPPSLSCNVDKFADSPSQALHSRASRVILTVVFVVAIALAFVASIALAVVNFYFWRGKGSLVPTFLSSNATFGAWSVTSAVIDVLISAVLAIGLQASIRGFNRVTDSVLRKIIRLAMRTAAYTALFAVIGGASGSRALLHIINAKGNVAMQQFWRFRFRMDPTEASTLLFYCSCRRSIQYLCA